MDDRFIAIAAHAAAQHGIFDLTEARRWGITDRMRNHWVDTGRIQRLGPTVFRVAGAPDSWRQRLLAAARSLSPGGVIAGRSAARLHGLDGFADGPIELLAPRALRSRTTSGTVAFTSRPIPRADRCTIDGLPVLRAERMVLEAPLHGLTLVDIENMVDSSIRLRLTTEARLRRRFAAEVPTGINGRSLLGRALVDTGGESSLERAFLRTVRISGLPRPLLRRTYRSDGRTIARVDAEFPDGLVVELAGHASHSSRRQRQRDAQRHTELTLAGKRVLTFTFEDQRDRPEWIVAQLRAAGVRAA
jgi:hypothetical protein